MRAWIILAAWLQAVGPALAASLPDELLRGLRAGQPVDVIVELDAAAIDRQAATQRARLQQRIDDDTALDRRAARYSALKDEVLRPLRRADIEDLLDYRHLPLSVKRVRSEAALRALAARPGVRALHADRLHQRVLADSLPLIGQPVVAAAGLRGAGTTVAVIDDGIDLAQSAFGGCTAVATPASCRIAAVQTFVASPGAGSAHGTNVAAIVIGVAPDARVASLDVFTSSGAPSSAILNAINWSIANRSSLNIAAINLSLGDNGHATTPCSGSPFAAAIGNARNAGIGVVVAAGNNAYDSGAYVDGLSGPACVPGAVSVGAVYDRAMGGLIWGNGTATQCTDGSIAADQVACFSNSASYLSLLAPGAMIAAGGSTQGGTSMAAPHVAGTLAVLRSGFANETLAMTEARLAANGRPVADVRNGRTQPRLNLLAAARPHNDDFVNADLLSAASGAVPGSNRLATLEPGEPQPAPSAAASVWWRWTAPATGQLSLDTAGSGTDTRLDVYRGSALAGLTQITGNDNASAQTQTSALRFQAHSGTTYHWSVGNATAGSGDLSLQWGLNTNAQANLSVSLTGPGSALPGSSVNYTLTVANAGPQSATGVIATVALPAGISVAALPVGCTAFGTSIVCNAAELASGAALAHLLSLQIDSLSGPVGLTASLSSEVPDPQSSDNTSSAPVAPAGFGDADIPTLPEWGMLLLGSLLLWRMQATDQRRARTC